MSEPLYGLCAGCLDKELFSPQMGAPCVICRIWELEATLGFGASAKRRIALTALVAAAKEWRDYGRKIFAEDLGPNAEELAGLERYEQALVNALDAVTEVKP